LAFGDSNKAIYIYPYDQLAHILKESANPFNSDQRTNKKFVAYPEGGNINKLILNYHNDNVNALVFTKFYRNFLISGGSDKSLIIWKIIEENFTYEKMRILKNQSEVTDLTITPNDEFIFTASIDNNVYIWKSNFSTNTFELVNCINNIHINYITSICLDPNLEKVNVNDLSNYMSSNGIKFCSYSDGGKLVIAETFPSIQGFRNNTIKEFKEFINEKNKINSIQKKVE